MSLTVRFCGAARTVTGSCFLFDTGSGRLLVDCGLFQGPKTLKALNYGAFPFRPADIDAVLLTVLLVGFQAHGTLGRFLADGAKAVRIQGEVIKVDARIRRIDEYSGHADGPELARWIAARRPVRRGVFLVHGEEPALRGLSERIAERTIPAAQVSSRADDIYELSTSAPMPIDVAHRRRLAPEAVVALDWHNDMSKLILDLNDRIEAAADDRARGVIIRRVRRALEAEH